MGLVDLVGCGPVLVLVPHADDETLGCGALLSGCWRGGVGAHVVCLTDGAASHPRSAADVAAIRAGELAQAIAILGGDPVRDQTWLGHPDAASHAVPVDQLTDPLTALVDRQRVRVLVAPSPLDPHCDHVAAAAVADRLLAARPALRLMHDPVWSRRLGGGVPPAVPRSRRRRYPVDAVLKARAIAAHASQQGRVIRDDSGGFAMPEGCAAMFAAGPELYDGRTA